MEKLDRNVESWLIHGQTFEIEEDMLYSVWFSCLLLMAIFLKFIGEIIIWILLFKHPLEYIFIEESSKKPINVLSENLLMFNNKCCASSNMFGSLFVTKSLMP